MIELRHLSKRFANADRDAVSDLNLAVSEGEFLVLIGESGCGKTTTLNMINRLVEKGILTRKPYQGVRLTPAGETLATRVITTKPNGKRVASVAVSLIAFFGVYMIVFGAGIVYMLRLMSTAPDGGEGSPDEGPTRAAAMSPLHPGTGEGSR